MYQDRMTGFVRYNMPQNAPGSLSPAAAYDVSTYVLSHHRTPGEVFLAAEDGQSS